MKNQTRRFLPPLLRAAGFAFSLGVAPLAASAEAFPEAGKPITLIVPTDPGGGIDVLARKIGPMLARELGTEIEIVNRPGGGVQVGLTYCASAKPDGYTLCTGGMPSLNATYMVPGRNAPYNGDSFAMIGNYSGDAAAVIVPANSPFKDWDSFLAAAKARPGELSIGNAGRFSGTHLATGALEAVTETRFRPVYFTGGAPAITALLGGHVDAVITTPSNFLPLAQSGDVRVLALMAPEEDDQIPGVRTLTEMGYGSETQPAQFMFSQVLIAPAGVPEDRLDRLRDALAKVVALPDFAKDLTALGVKPYYQNAADARATWTTYDALVASMVAAPAAQ